MSVLAPSVTSLHSMVLLRKTELGCSTEQDREKSLLGGAVTILVMEGDTVTLRLGTGEGRREGGREGGRGGKDLTSKKDNATKDWNYV